MCTRVNLRFFEKATQFLVSKGKRMNFVVFSEYMNFKTTSSWECGLGSRIRDEEAFWYKTEIIYFVRLCWLCVIVWFTLTLNFWYLKLKNILIFFWGWRVIFLIQCYQARHLHWNKLLSWMYGLAVIVSVPKLNICQILMR